jgi:hypothetical protein
MGLAALDRQQNLERGFAGLRECRHFLLS